MSYGHDDHDHGHHHQDSHWGPHDWEFDYGHGVIGGAPHNSWAPIMIALGSSLFLLGFTKVFTQSWNDTYDVWDYAIHSSQIGILIVGLSVMFAGFFVWWRQDWSFSGAYEPKAIGTPFQSIEIRKVAIWMFLMSEMMVFSSLFSTYIRYRTGFDNCVELFETSQAAGIPIEPGTSCWLPASYFIAEGGYHQENANAVLQFMPDTLIPGAINTFALIISSYTIVLALKTAKMSNEKYATTFDIDVDVVDRHRSRKIGNYLLATLVLATMFLCFKLIEWFIGFEIGDHDNPIFYAPSLMEDKFTIHSSEYTYCHLYDEAAHACTAGNEAIFDIRMSASTFYVTTGTHGVHVFGGMVALAYMVLKAFRGGYTPQNAVSIEYFGLYWHFVDLVWVLVFPAFYLY